MTFLRKIIGAVAGLAAYGLVAAFPAQAAINGVTGTTFNLTAEPAYISAGDGTNLLVWGYGVQGALPQYPGPTLIVNQGDTITVNLTNTLTEPVSVVFQGIEGVTATGGAAGLLTREAGPGGGTVSYTFTATHPGTYLYHSGSHPELQIEMGLVGALIVRSATANQAYNHPGTAFDQEFLLVLTEMDPRIHEAVEAGTAVDNTAYHPVLWFLNGRNAPDTMLDSGVPWLPHQPYGAHLHTHPGDRMLLRMVAAGRDLHPFHTHGNHTTLIARDGRMLESAPGKGPDLGISNFTLQAEPGATYDALFSWTGYKLGWDIYGHAPGDALEPNEYAPDHGKPLPVILPEQQNMTFGGSYSGSPFLGSFGTLPPGQGGLNLNGGLYFMWHSHTEKEMVNNDIFPGGMMTMIVVDPHHPPAP